VIKNTAQGGVFITDTPHHFYSAYISALIGVLEKAHLLSVICYLLSVTYSQASRHGPFPAGNVTVDGGVHHADLAVRVTNGKGA